MVVARASTDAEQAGGGVAGVAALAEVAAAAAVADAGGAVLVMVTGWLLVPGLVKENLRLVRAAENFNYRIS